MLGNPNNLQFPAPKGDNNRSISKSPKKTITDQPITMSNKLNLKERSPVPEKHEEMEVNKQKARPFCTIQTYKLLNLQEEIQKRPFRLSPQSTNSYTRDESKITKFFI